MAISIGESLYLLQQLGVEKVSVDQLIETFIKVQPVQDSGLAPEIAVPVAPPVQELPPPPPPPAEAPEVAQEPLKVVVYKNYQDASDNATTSQKVVLDKSLGGYVLMDV